MTWSELGTQFGWRKCAGAGELGKRRSVADLIQLRSHFRVLAGSSQADLQNPNRIWRMNWLEKTETKATPASKALIGGDEVDQSFCFRCYGSVYRERERDQEKSEIEKTAWAPPKMQARLPFLQTSMNRLLS